MQPKSPPSDTIFMKALTYWGRHGLLSMSADQWMQKCEGPMPQCIATVSSPQICKPTMCKPMNMAVLLWLMDVCCVMIESRVLCQNQNSLVYKMKIAESGGIIFIIWFPNYVAYFMQAGLFHISNTDHNKILCPVSPHNKTCNTNLFNRQKR